MWSEKYNFSTLVSYIHVTRVTRILVYVCMDRISQDASELRIVDKGTIYIVYIYIVYFFLLNISFLGQIISSTYSLLTYYFTHWFYTLFNYRLNISLLHVQLHRLNTSLPCTYKFRNEKFNSIFISLSRRSLYKYNVVENFLFSMEKQKGNSGANR